MRDGFNQPSKSIALGPGQRVLERLEQPRQARPVGGAGADDGRGGMAGAREASTPFIVAKLAWTWAAFAASGVPEKAWPRYDPHTDANVLLDTGAAFGQHEAGWRAPFCAVLYP